MINLGMKRFLIVAITVISSYGCCFSSPSSPSPPHLISINPSSGPPGTLVSIQFSGTIQSGSWADAGGSREALYNFYYSNNNIFTVVPSTAKQAI